MRTAPPTGRGPVEDRGPAAVSPHHLASRAAVSIMEAGGNAVDGAIAANAVLGVVLPTTCGIGGDLLALVHRPGEGAPATLNASGRGGEGHDPAALEGLPGIPLYGRESVTVPGCVDGWVALTERFGTRPLADLLEPAMRIARGGFEVSTELSAALQRLHPRIGDQPSSGPLYPGGLPPAAGSEIHRPLLAETMEGIAAEGRRAFYEGPVASAVIGATGGRLSPDDLAGNRPDWVDPIGIEVFDATAWTVPPNSQGYLALAAAWLLEQSGAPGDPGDPAFHHAVVESYRAMAWEREETVADPGFAPMPPERLLDPRRLAERVEAVQRGSAQRWPAPRPADGGTAYFCTADGDGMGVSIIQSNFHGIGAGISAGETGVWLQNRGAGFTLEPGHPNRSGRGKRPLHTLAPTLWSDDGELRLLLGTRGGHQQPQYVLQTAALLFGADLSPTEAQEAPRWSMQHAAAGTTSHLMMERRSPTAIVDGLRGRGHRVDLHDDYPPGWGPVSVIAARPGGWDAAADPRVTTAAAVAPGAGETPAPPR